MYSINNTVYSQKLSGFIEDSASRESFIREIPSHFTIDEVELIIDSLINIPVEDKKIFINKWIQLIQNDIYIIAKKNGFSDLDIQAIQNISTIKKEDLTHVIDQTILFGHKYYQTVIDNKPLLTDSHLINFMKLISELPKEAAKGTVTQFFSWLNDQTFISATTFNDLIKVFVFFFEIESKKDLKNISEKIGQLPTHFTLDEIKNIINSLPNFSEEDIEDLLGEFFFFEIDSIKSQKDSENISEKIGQLPTHFTINDVKNIINSLDDLSIYEISTIVSLLDHFSIEKVECIISELTNYSVKDRKNILAQVKEIGDEFPMDEIWNITNMLDENIPAEDHVFFIRMWKELTSSDAIEGFIHMQGYWSKLTESPEIEILEALLTIKKQDLENVVNQIIQLTDNYCYQNPDCANEFHLFINMIKDMAIIPPKHRNNIVTVVNNYVKYAPSNYTDWRMAEEKLDLAAQFFSSYTLPWENYPGNITDIIKVMDLLKPEHRTNSIIEFIAYIPSYYREDMTKIINKLPSGYENEIVESVKNNLIKYEISVQEYSDIAIKIFKIILSKYESTNCLIKWKDDEDIEKIITAVMKIPKYDQYDLIRNVIDNIDSIDTVSDAINRLSTRSWYQTCSIS